MAYYSNYPLNSDDVTREAGSYCCSYGTGQSHARIIQGAGGEIGYDWFKDPRPNHDGPIYAETVFINERSNQIQGINFNDRDGKFCCSYLGMSYQDIKDSNKRDIANKQVQIKNFGEKQVEYDEFGVAKSSSNVQSQTQTQQYGIKR